MTKTISKSKGLPPKPYTEYTIFFRLERTHILQASGIIDEEILASLDPNHSDALEFPRPTKYQNLTLSPYWYSSLHKGAIEKKRKHRKREGRMDLKTLSKTISASWRNADPLIVEYCRKLAKAELEKYDELFEGIMNQQEDEKNTAATTGTMTQPQPDASLFGNNMNNYNKVKGYGQVSQGPEEVFLKMLQLQQLQMAHANNAIMNQRSRYGDPSPTTSGDASHTTSVGSTSPSQKRKFVRRASASPEFMRQDVTTNIFNNGNVGNNICGNNMMMPSNLGNNNFMAPNSMGTNTNVFLGEDNGNPTKQMKQQFNGRSSASSSATSNMIPSQDFQELQALRRAYMSSMASNNNEVFNIGTADNSNNNDGMTNSSTKPRTFKTRSRSSLAPRVPSQEHQALSSSFQQELMCYPVGGSGTNSEVFNNFSFNNIDNTINKPKTFEEIRRSSIVSLEPSSQEDQELKSLFQQESKDAGSFTDVPEWEKKDSDMLLDILNVIF